MTEQSIEVQTQLSDQSLNQLPEVNNGNVETSTKRKKKIKTIDADEQILNSNKLIFYMIQ